MQRTMALTGAGMERLNAIRKLGWYVLIESDPAGWRVELVAGEECLCVDTPCPHRSAYVEETGGDLWATVEAAVARAVRMDAVR